MASEGFEPRAGGNVASDGLVEMITVAIQVVAQWSGTCILDGSTGGDDEQQFVVFRKNAPNSFDDIAVHAFLVTTIVGKT